MFLRIKVNKSTERKEKYNMKNVREKEMTCIKIVNKKQINMIATMIRISIIKGKPIKVEETITKRSTKRSIKRSKISSKIKSKKF